MTSSLHEKNKIIQQLVGKDGSHVFLSNLPTRVLAEKYNYKELEAIYYASRERLPFLFHHHDDNKVSNLVEGINMNQPKVERRSQNQNN